MGPTPRPQIRALTGILVPDLGSGFEPVYYSNMGKMIAAASSSGLWVMREAVLEVEATRQQGTPVG